MRFISFYKPGAEATPPSPQHLAEMGKYIEASFKAGFLLSTDGLLPSAKGARMESTPENSRSPMGRLLKLRK